MRIPDEGDRFFGCHIMGVDIIGPASADLLLSLEVIGGHALHGRGHISERFRLGRQHDPVFPDDVENDGNQDGQDDQYVSQNDDAFFHLEYLRLRHGGFGRLPGSRP